ncbi:chromosome segregation protein SMC [Thermomicrobium sp. 4228-Ro]|uniref:chromosome segregation protein SMC n=1 Tax=Thermomicrobium sp. 4228-Ro TaxID=2993937 RepID=UPI002248D1C6|nr:chromosome segregation protein SMC [Thermomicrobium sp. 4228-Ro]MCX2726940.1 chromosome segregation protein SMC [Thermomicrobium sp. 4228-Ro]
MGIRLTRLSVIGFKSFADPLELVFDPGITAIVGPNGSGKSNLAEAIAWVLGEQSSAAVRSRRAEDVIFAGGPGRAPLGMAEVTLVLEQDNEELGLPFREVSLTRRVFRDGESQYLINGARARLRDVLRIAATLRADWIIVRQGAVDALLDQRPAERRDYLEHAAGLSALRLRQAEARQQLSEAEQHARRLEDLLHELEPHVQALATAAERAREALALRDTLRETTLRLFAARWRHVQREMEHLRERLAELEEQRRALQPLLEDRTRSLAAHRAECETLRMRYDEIARLRHERERAVEMLQHRAQLARTRAAALAAQLQTLAGDRDRVAEELEMLRAETQRLEALSRTIGDDISRVQDALDRQEQLLAERRERARVVRAELAALEQELRRAAVAREQCAREQAALVAASEARRQELARLEALHRQLEEEWSARERERTELANRSAVLEARLSAARADVERWSAQVAQRRTEREQRQQVVQELERELTVTRTRLEALVHALEHELVAHSTRAVLSAAKRGQLTGVVGTLGALLDVPAELEQAIEAVLGGHLSDLVVERWADAEAAIAFLKENRAGRATFHPLDTVRAVPPGRAPLVLGEPGVIGVAAELVSASPELGPIVQSLLGRVLVVTDLATARRVLHDLPPGWVVVTREGELARPTGAVTGGAGRPRDRGVLASARERRALTARIDRLAAHLAEAQREAESADDAYEHARACAASAEDTLRALEHEYRELLAQRERLEREQRAFCEPLRQQEQTIEELRTVVERETQRIAELAEEEAALVAALEALESRQRSLTAELQAVEAPDPDRERLAATLVTLRERLEAVTREHAQIDRQIARLEATVAEYEARAAVLVREHLAALTEAERAEEEASALAGELAQLELRSAALGDALRQYEQERAALATACSQLEHQLRTVESELAQTQAAYERAAEAERVVLENAAWELSWSEDRSRLADELRAVAASVIDPPERLERRITELRRRWQELSRFGEAAIAHYERERARHDRLRAELDDVRTTIRTLRKLSADLDQQIERGFARSLRALDRALEKTFGELFGGGRAHLVARDGTGAIEGVELVVQPAGKRVRSVQQLSGGERALTAIALRFALLELDPLPFCVLDEVDAALDEANVLRFRSVLERLATRTQFLVITHNRATIEAAGTLYGVTMGDDGVSRVVALRLADYVQPDR